jgi:LysM repeat protein
LHTIAKGDTLLGIAIKYGLKLEDLQAANPEVDANLLVIGQALIIPLAGVTTPTPIATPTPAPAALSAPHCYPAADGGLWCLLLARNEGPLALENLSAWVGLFSVSGEAQASQVAVSPLNLLPAGQAAPLAAYFSAPAPAEATPRAGLLTALTVPVSDTRYLTATLQIDALEIDASGLQATVEGQVKLPAGGPPAAVVWVAAVAYDAQEQPVGIRKWEAHAPCPAPVEGSPMPPCGPVPFNLTVYSLGPAIARIEVLIEARP